MNTIYDQNTKDTGFIWLVDFGWHRAVRADSIQSGDVIVWNCGETSKVLGEVKRTAKTIVFSIDCSGKIEERRFNIDRLVAVRR